MKILVCVRQGLDGTINPFDACAYEEALNISGSEVILISMGPPTTKEFLHNLTRLGAKKAILLSDTSFAGADTLATAYTLSLAVKKIKPDLIFCGRQTLIGDTAQTGPMLSVYSNFNLITNVMCIEEIGSNISCLTRDNIKETVELPALLTIERINNLRLPSITSKLGELEIWDSLDINADIDRCGLKGSPTRVIKSFENESGKRKCKFISPIELNEIIDKSLNKNTSTDFFDISSDKKISKVYIVGNSPIKFAKSISDDICVLPILDAKSIAHEILVNKPNVVLWGGDLLSKKTAAQVSAMLNLGLCADCTLLETDGSTLYMYRPALSGSVIAKIVSNSKPVMATVKTMQDSSDILVGVGYGAKHCISTVKAFADNLSAELVASRKAVDNDLMPYSMQVGLTGKTVSPKIYIPVGISGAIHHITGMNKSGTVIAINNDKDAPIFEYADYGILGNIEDVLMI